MSEKFSFKQEATLKNGLGRAGIIETPHGVIHTPAFVVVGTQASVKALTPEMVRDLGAEVVLANTYHLYLEPGDEIVRTAGGFPKMMNWNGPSMTDSGGFQVFSLGEAFGAKVSKVATGEDEAVSERFGYDSTKKLAFIDEEGVTFKSYRDGSSHRFTPERSMEIQWNLAADIIFAFDECTSPLAPHEYQKEAMERTHRWALRSLEAHEALDTENKQALFGVVQGGRFKDLREESARTLAEMKSASGASFDGFGIGGSFNKEDLVTAVGWVTRVLPKDKPRHLLGIGDPRDLFGGVEEGIDTFDCVAATRIARNGTYYTHDGQIHISNSKFRTDHTPIEAGCECYTCRNYSRAYLAHLMRAGEMLGSTLGSIHNLYFIVNLVKRIRQSIIDENFYEFKDSFLERYCGK